MVLFIATSVTGRVRGGSAAFPFERRGTRYPAAGHHRARQEGYILWNANARPGGAKVTSGARGRGQAWSSAAGPGGRAGTATSAAAARSARGQGTQAGAISWRVGPKSAALERPGVAHPRIVTDVATAQQVSRAAALSVRSVTTGARWRATGAGPASAGPRRTPPTAAAATRRRSERACGQRLTAGAGMDDEARRVQRTASDAGVVRRKRQAHAGAMSRRRAHGVVGARPRRSSRTTA
jgi:hypothetical protein